MKLIIFIFVCFLFVSCPFLPFLVQNLHNIIGQFIVSIYDYFKYKKGNICNDYGFIDCYCGLFGQGKTKQAVKRVTDIYKRYNGLDIWDSYNQMWVKQEVRIFSNVELSAVPYERFNSMQQMVDCQESAFGIINIFLIDEASVVFNSRDFKSNFNTLALNTILTSRHHRIGIILTSQRFNHLDALLRQVVSHVIQCHYMPFLHIQREVCYNAWDLECSKNPMLCKPLWLRYSFTSSLLYSYYNTFAMVEKVAKDCTENKFVSDSDTLQNQGSYLYDKGVNNSSLRQKNLKKLSKK